MALESGTRLGPYEIVARLGAGGMGEVYRARDTRLGRSVAIKVLPDRVIAKRPESRQRFEREARIIAALNHAHICQIFDVGQEGGTDYLVMEFVEGETLKERLKRGPLPPRMVLRYAIEIAEALDGAHRRGIIHRDLKPGNIMLAKDGAKVLDFGLSITKTYEAVSSLPEAERSTLPTEPLSLTGEGLVVGTLPYMAPELLRGGTADSRSDIFAFGAVLYEMATGHRAFEAKSQADLIVNVLQHDPPSISSVQPVLPTALDRVVRRCMVKDPEERWQSARDLADELKWIAATDVELSAPRPKRKRWFPAAAAAALVLIAAFAAGLWWRGARRPTAPSWTGALLGGPRIALDPRVSPDGQMLALQAMVDGLTQVAVMKPETGNWMVLTSDRKRGQVMEISWARDGTRLYFDRNADVPRGVFSVGVLGGEERLVLEDAAFPEVLPDRSLMVARINGERQLQLHRFWPDTGRLQAFAVELKAISGAPVRAFPDGREVVFFGRPLGDSGPESLYTLELATGRTRRLAPGLTIRLVNNLLPLAVTPDGKWVLTNVPGGNLHRIVAIPRDGGATVRPLLTATLIPWYLDVGPDGSLYFEQIDQSCEVLLFGKAGGVPERVAASAAFRFGSIAAIGGAKVMVSAMLGGRTRIMVAQPGREPAPLSDTTEESRPPMARVGEREVAFLSGAGVESGIAIASAEDGRILRRIKGPGGTIESLAASPDGKTLYYVTSRSVWAIAAEGGEPRKLAPGDAVAASPDGRELLVERNQRDGSRLVRVPLNGGAEKPIAVHGDLRLTATALGDNAIAKDGRILVQVASPDSWFWRTAVLDPVSGQVTRVPVEYEGDLFYAGWSGDGRIVALGIPIRGGVWRFQPEIGGGFGAR